MKLKFLGCVFLCLILFVSSGLKLNRTKTNAIIQEDPEINEQKSKQKNSIKDIVTIATALTDYVTDHGVAPEQEGTYDENVEFQKALSPFYVRNLPINDGWFNAYRVYCGEACNGKYGISGCGPDDFVVVSYGRDGEKEDWLYDSNNPEAGLYEVVTLDDFDKDIVMWNGSWMRAPSFVR